jgi:lysozyme
MKISENGLSLIKQLEGLSLKPYLDKVNIPTIGFGSTYYEDGTKVKLKDKPITEERATELLEFIANKTFSENINKVVKVPLNQNQFDALVSFAYNIGNKNFNWSTLLKKLNQSDYEGASLEFGRWNQASGKILSGLVLRRQKERELFLTH